MRARHAPVHLLARGAWLVAFVALLTAAACSRPRSRELQPGSYRAVLELPGKRELPFGLDVAREESGLVLYVINGDERVRVSDVESAPGHLAARFPGYETTLEATIEGGDLSGTIALVHAAGRRLELPFHARLGETWRFFEKPLEDNADMSGLWDATLTDASGRASRGIADFAQRFADVTGTLVFATGDERFLGGEVRDEVLKLSRFDGGAAVLVEARLDEQGRLVGEVWSDRAGARKLVAARNPDATLDITAVAARLRNPTVPFRYAFTSVGGLRVSSSDPARDGKVQVVTLGGSWCPNSHDEAALLNRIDRRYRNRGLSIVGLMFEQYADPKRAAAAVQRFRQASGVEYPTLVAGTMDRAAAAKAVPQLEAVRAYPTTLFIDRTGRVRKIQSAFFGPATGIRHDLLTSEYVSTVENLLAEGKPAPTTDPVANQVIEAPAN